MSALADPDPQVQANVIPQLRGRGIPGVLPSLMELVESPYTVVRKAARESLAEFSFKRFVAAFDMLDEDVRRSTGLLVKKVNVQSVSLLNDELKSPIRSAPSPRSDDRPHDRRRRVGSKSEIIEMLQDEDHLVRMEAAVTLGESVSPAGVAALTEALNDKSEVVRLAAQRSLQEAIETRPPACEELQVCRGSPWT